MGFKSLLALFVTVVIMMAISEAANLDAHAPSPSSGNLPLSSVAASVNKEQVVRPNDILENVHNSTNSDGGHASTKCGGCASECKKTKECCHGFTCATAPGLGIAYCFKTGCVLPTAK